MSQRLASLFEGAGGPFRRPVVLGLACALATIGCTGAIRDPAAAHGPGSLGPRQSMNAAGQDGADPSGSPTGPASLPGGKGAPTTGPTSPTSDPGLDCTAVTVGATPLVRLNRNQYQNSVRDLLGVPASAIDTSAIAEDEKVGPFASNTAAPVSELVIEQYMESAEALALAAAKKLEGLVACDRTQLGDDACAASFIDAFGRRAYRRPLATEEGASYQALYTAYVGSAGFADTLRIVVQTMLQSPSFLYHVELQPPAPGADATVPLDAYELASRLSFFLASTTPDDALLDAAASGMLATDPAELRAQAQRLLALRGASDTFASFHLQWLELDKLNGLSKDTATYPSFDPALATAMRNETVHFVDYVLRHGDGKLDTLLTAPYSFPEGALFELYGVTQPAGADPAQPVQLDPAQRAGLLTQPSFLAVHAHENQSAPVQRGKVVIRNVLCESLPDPPPNVNTTPPDPSPNATTRQRFAIHESEATCAGCHKRIDGIGMGFEAYDGIGAFRTRDGTQAVDASGTLMSTADLDGPFDGVVDLEKKLASSAEVQQCVATQWLRFALGRIETDADRCSLAQLHQAFDASGHDVRALIVAVVMSDAFREKRTIKEGAP
jgi:hypothetical protein